MHTNLISAAAGATLITSLSVSMTTAPAFAQRDHDTVQSTVRSTTPSTTPSITPSITQPPGEPTTLPTTRPLDIVEYIAHRKEWWAARWPQLLPVRP